MKTEKRQRRRRRNKLHLYSIIYVYVNHARARAHTHIHTHLHMYSQIFIHTSRNIHTYTHTQKYMNTLTYTQLHTYTSTHTYMHIHTCTLTYKYTHIYTPIYIYIYTYICKNSIDTWSTALDDVYSIIVPIYRPIGQVDRVFADSPGVRASISGRVIPKTQKWYLILPCLTISILRYVSSVKWRYPGKGVAHSPTPRCWSY